MDKWQAIQTFWEGFGFPAYDENTVPSGEDAPPFPYITYSMQTGAMDEPVALSASLWDRSDSWERISKAADAIAEEIGYGHVMLRVTGGFVMIHRGTPFAQRMADEDDSIRRIYMIINVEYLTAF